MKRALIIGIISYIFGLIMIMVGLYLGVEFGNIELVTLKDRFSTLGMCALMIFGGVGLAIGYILIRIYLDDKD